MTANNEV